MSSATERPLGRPIHRALAIAASLALIGGVAACGGDDDETSTAADTSATSTTADSGSAEDVTVSATEFEFDVSATPTADTKTITFDNQGEQFHVLVFAKINDGFTVDEAVELQGKKGSAVDIGSTEAKPGESTEIAVKQPLDPGNYVLLCPLSGPEGPALQARPARRVRDRLGAQAPRA